MAFEENEISSKSQGGTEITKRSIDKLIPKELSDNFQVIASRVREIEQEKIRIYWQHDLAEDPEVNHLKNVSSRNRFHKLVFSSNWQLNEFITKLGIPQDEKIQVIETPVEPFPSIEKKFDGKINLIYFSTPQRGLQLLIPVFSKLVEKYPNIHLDVFSSFKIYGWEEMDEKFNQLYDMVREHPNMTYHGFAPAETLREHLLKAHILAYPCIWKETACRVLIESMSAGLFCVHPNLAALSDTSGGLTAMYQYCDDFNKHASVFYQYLDHAINTIQTDEIQNYLKFTKVYADSRFNIGKVSKQWELLMQDLLKVYPDIASRKLIETPVFVYRT